MGEWYGRVRMVQRNITTINSIIHLLLGPSEGMYSFDQMVCWYQLRTKLI